MKHFFRLLPLLTMGCAQFPKNFSDLRETKIKFSFTVEGKINRDYIYIVAICASKEVNSLQENGPLPIVEYPSSNGFVGGKCTHYVEWKYTNTPPFELYKFIDHTLKTKRFIGSPDVFDPIEPGSKKISFELTTDQLAQGSTITAEEIKSLKVNFLTMNRLYLNENDDKIGDSLGGTDPTQSAWINVPLNANMVYDNAFYGYKKPSGNIPDPNLKITDFSVEVTQPN